MREVARAAGVSVSSVSRILGGDSAKFAARTVVRVREAVERLNYRPNATARSLFTGSTKMAGVMVPAGGFYGDVLIGLNETLFEHGHLMLHAWNPSGTDATDDPTEARIVHELVERMVDGIILRPSSEEFEPDYFREIWQRGIPLILLDREMSLFKTDFVGTDDLAVGEEAARCLLELGHRRLLFVGLDIQCSTSYLRGQGFRNVISETPDAACRSATMSTELQGLERIEPILREPDRPTAVFCYSDPLATCMLPLLGELGLRVPEDVSIIGCGSVPGSPGLTSFDQQALEIGHQAGKLYLERVEHPEQRAAPKTVRIPARLLVRGTTGPAPPRA